MVLLIFSRSVLFYLGWSCSYSICRFYPRRTSTLWVLTYLFPTFQLYCQLHFTDESKRGCLFATGDSHDCLFIYLDVIFFTRKYPKVITDEMLTLYLACVFFATFFHKQFYAVKFSHCSLTIHLYILLNNVHHCRRSFYTFLHLLHDYQNVLIPKYILKLHNKFSFSAL